MKTKRLIRAALLAGLTALLAAPASAAPEPAGAMKIDSASTGSSKIRTFFMPVDKGAKPSAFYFNALTTEFAVCANGDQSQCKQWKIPAQDVIPYTTHTGDMRLLVLDSHIAFRTCKAMTNRSLDCIPISVSELFASSKPLFASSAALVASC